MSFDKIAAANGSADELNYHIPWKECHNTTDNSGFDIRRSSAFVDGARWQFEQDQKVIAALRAEKLGHLALIDGLQTEVDRLFNIKINTAIDHPVYKASKELEVELKEARDEISNLKYENKLLQEYIVPMGGISTKILNRLQAELAKRDERLSKLRAILIETIRAPTSLATVLPYFEKALAADDKAGES